MMLKREENSVLVVLAIFASCGRNARLYIHSLSKLLFETGRIEGGRARAGGRGPFV
jgi:hypothetical protein